jgi:hypothetical protein
LPLRLLERRETLQRCFGTLERSDARRVIDFPSLAALKDGIDRLQSKCNSQSTQEALSSVQGALLVVATFNRWITEHLSIEDEANIVWGLTFLLFEVRIDSG